MMTILSPKLIKSLKDIQDPILRNRYIKYHQLTDEIKNSLSSDETNAVIKNIVAKNNFSDYQWQQTSLAVAKVLLSELHPRDLEKYLEENLEVDEFAAVEIAKDIKNQILAPIKEDLMKLYPGSAAPARYAEPIARHSRVRVSPEVLAEAQGGNPAFSRSEIPASSDAIGFGRRLSAGMAIDVKTANLQQPQTPQNLPIKPNQSIVTTEKNVVKVGK